MGNAAKTLQDGDSNNKPFRGFGYFFRAPLPVHGPTARRRPWVGRPWPPTVYCTQYSGGRRRTSGTRKRWIHCFSCPSMYRLCIRAPRSPISTKCPPRSRRAPGNPLSPGFISRLGDGDARNRNGLFNGTCTKLMTGSSGCGRGGSQGIEYLWTCGDHCANSTLNSLSGRYPAATDRTERSGPLGSYTVGKVHARLPLGRSRTLNRCGGTEGHPSCRVGEPWNIGATLACVF
jgi:hypothetical protein